MHYKNILWDFDGVIIDSMEIRTQGFRSVLNNYPEENVESLVEYHLTNGGLSRYNKFEYFITKILHEEKDPEKVDQWVVRFEEIMKQSLNNGELLIQDSLDFIERSQELNMHIVSGSDERELKWLTKALGISKLFKSIHGSPSPKISLVKQLIKEFGYNKEECCLIGDSLNDFEAANQNEIDFFGYNNNKLRSKGADYIDEFSTYAWP